MRIADLNSGHIMLSAAMFLGILQGQCNVGSPQSHPPDDCLIVDQGKWQQTQLGGSGVEEPLCPVIVTFHEWPKSYSMNIIASNPALISGGPGKITWYDNRLRLIGAPQQQHTLVFWNGNTAQPWGTVFMATDSQHTTGEMYDHGRIAIPRVMANDTARGEALLRYQFHAQAGASFPTLGSTNQSMVFVIDAMAEFRPISYQWFVDGVNQGINGGTFSTVFSQPGTYFVRGKSTANDGHVLDQTVTVEITPCPNGEIIC
jgi:hypothetical protein